MHSLQGGLHSTRAAGSSTESSQLSALQRLALPSSPRPVWVNCRCHPGNALQGQYVSSTVSTHQRFLDAQRNVGFDEVLKEVSRGYNQTSEISEDHHEFMVVPGCFVSAATATSKGRNPVLRKTPYLSVKKLRPIRQCNNEGGAETSRRST